MNPDEVLNQRRSGQHLRSVVRILGIVALNAFLYWIYGNRPLVADASEWADDALYLRQAEGFVNWLHGSTTGWLGQYDHLILSKAPFFPVWLGLLHVFHIPLRIAEYILVLSLPWLFRAAVRPVLDLSWPQLAVATIVLSALPVLPFEQRLLRTALQLALTSGCLIAGIGLMLRARLAVAHLGGWATLTGALFALAYVNREETTWLIPMICCALVAIVIGAWFRRSVRLGLIAAACLLGSTTIPIAVVSALNAQSYGVFFTTVRRAPAFVRAHQLMTRLEPQTRERYVPIRTETRIKAYSLSPTFALLRPYLEGPPTDKFARAAGTLALYGRPPTDRELFVMHFQFALQEGVFELGARTAPAAERLFAHIGDELESTISSGRIDAGSPGPSTIAALLPGDYELLVMQTAESVRQLYTLEAMTLPQAGVSSGDSADLIRFEQMTHMAIAPVAPIKSDPAHADAAPLRRVAYNLITKLEATLYALSTGGLLAFVVVTFVRHRSDRTRVDQACVGIILCGSLIAFSFIMAAVDLLAFPMLRSGIAYNTLGYSPLSVLCAFGLVVLTAWLRTSTSRSSPMQKLSQVVGFSVHVRVLRSEERVRTVGS